MSHFRWSKLFFNRFRSLGMGILLKSILGRFKRSHCSLCGLKTARLIAFKRGQCCLSCLKTGGSLVEMLECQGQVRSYRTCDDKDFENYTRILFF